MNGGIWPIHCVAGEKGSALDRHFFADIIDVKNRPNEENIFHKGMDDIVEEYSAFHGINKRDSTWHNGDRPCLCRWHCF